MATIANAPGGQDSSVGGSEKIPVDDAGTGKYLTVDQIKAYVIDAVEAIAAGTAVDGSDKIYILDATDSVLKPVDIDTVLQHIVDAIWAKTALTAPAADDVFLVKDGGVTEKTVTMSVLTTYILSAISSSILNVSGLADGSGALATSDYMLVTQGTTPKQITVAHLNALIYASLQAYITALTAVTTATGTDVFYCIQGGTPKKVTLTTIIAALESKLPASSTENNIPQFNNATGALKDGGLSVATTVAATGAVDTKLPTEQAVREALTKIIYEQTDMGSETLADADLILVDDGATGENQRKSALSKLWTYILSKIEAATAIVLKSPVVDTKLTFDETTNDLDITASDQSRASSSVNFPDLAGIDTTAVVIPTATNGTLPAGANDDFEPSILVYDKTADATGEVIDLHDGTYLGQILTIYLGTLGAGATAIITPVHSLSYATITLDAQYEIATLQWQGTTVGWAILYTTGTVA